MTTRDELAKQIAGLNEQTLQCFIDTSAFACAPATFDKRAMKAVWDVHDETRFNEILDTLLSRNLIVRADPQMKVVLPPHMNIERDNDFLKKQHARGEMLNIPLRQHPVVGEGRFIIEAEAHAFASELAERQKQKPQAPSPGL